MGNPGDERLGTGPGRKPIGDKPGDVRRPDDRIENRQRGVRSVIVYSSNMSRKQPEWDGFNRFPLMSNLIGAQRHSDLWGIVRNPRLLIRWSSVRSRPALLVPGKSGFFPLGRRSETVYSSFMSTESRQASIRRAQIGNFGNGYEQLGPQAL